MSAEFELEHWKSRATVAERERDAARVVLASLRFYFHRLERKQPVTIDLEPTRNRLREHDREWWTQEHAMNAVVEGLAGIHEDESAAHLAEGKGG